ncbi:EamA-like transporter family protein [Actinokineospora alba]|uniref:EamA-like transporter family protein n=1 Tax=Actinokineospora alba TaxID=504798 RepID=A0A1H0RSB8_9PSEU|nr:EamA-like transporter family protein [Actinokineospora alba]SDJ33704.1 EamA-like transporter family protein [Actinokineospora alba]SDP32451.1 EamA-like transporter family protein [Actinokineospora alba]
MDQSPVKLNPVTITIARPTRRGVAAGALACGFIGGSVPVSGLLTHYPILAGQSARYAVGAVLIAVWAMARRLPVTVPKLKDLPALLAVVGVGMIGFNIFLLTAQHHAEPGLVAAVIGGSPLVIALAAPLMSGARPAVRALAGAALVVAGIVVLSGGGTWSGPGLLLAVLTMLCEASFTLFAIGVVRRLGTFSVALWCHVLAAVCAGLLAVPFDGVFRLPTTVELVAVLAVAVITVVAFCLWYHSVSVLGAGRAAVLIGVMPVSGLVVAVALGAQPLTIVALAGASIVAAGCAVGLRG